MDLTEILVCLICLDCLSEDHLVFILWTCVLPYLYYGMEPKATGSAVSMSHMQSHRNLPHWTTAHLLAIKKVDKVHSGWTGIQLGIHCFHQYGEFIFIHHNQICPVPLESNSVIPYFNLWWDIHFVISYVIVYNISIK